MGKAFDTYQASTAGQQAERIKAAGYTSVALYLFRHSDFKEHNTREIAKALSDAGIYLISVYENGKPTTPGYFITDVAGADAHAADVLARGVGQPLGSVIYFAVDYDASAADLPAITAYFTEIRRVLRSLGTNGEMSYAVGVYGSGLVCSHLASAGLVSRTWLAQSTGWAGYVAWRPKADIVQGPVTHILGMDCDGDTTSGNAGGWQVQTA